MDFDRARLIIGVFLVMVGITLIALGVATSFSTFLICFLISFGGTSALIALVDIQS